MRMILEFDLMEEHAEAAMALKASDYHGALFCVREELRRVLKYDQDLTDSQFDVMSRFRKTFFDILETHDVNLDKE